MAKYPVFLELSGRRAVVVGAGAVAVRKVKALLEADARVVVVSKAVNDTLTSLCHGANIELVKSKYSENYIAGAVLVIAATNDRKLNEQIYKDCQKLEILCNVVDSPDLCDFTVPAVVRRGKLQIAIGTEGNCPAYSGHLRKKLEKIFTDKHGEFLAEMEDLRNQIIRDIQEPAARKVLLGKLVDDRSFEYFVENGSSEWRKYADELISKRNKS